MIEQAVANAIDQTVFALEGAEQEAGQGLEAECLIDSIRGVVDGLAKNLTAANVGDYLDLPTHQSVASIRRLHGHNGRLTRLVRAS